MGPPGSQGNYIRNVAAEPDALFTNNAADTTISGAKADSNLPPYVVRLYCKKVGTDTTVPSSASMATTLAS